MASRTSSVPEACVEGVDMRDKICDVCGQPYLVNENGVSHHIDNDSLTGIDHDADADHVPYGEEAHEGS